MIPPTLKDWFARGTTILVDTESLTAKALENVKIAAGVAEEMKGWSDNIIPAVYVPDGVTKSPANNFGRVVIVVYRERANQLLRLGAIIFEEGQASVTINKSPVDEFAPAGGEEHIGNFDLSDPGFPATIFQPFQPLLA